VDRISTGEPTGNDGELWTGYRRLVLSQLEELITEVKRLDGVDDSNREKLENKISALKDFVTEEFKKVSNEITALKTTNKVNSLWWGLIAGGVASLITSGIFWLMTH
jgi:ABC-type phosphate transport system auxiliary subunit